MAASFPSSDRSALVLLGNFIALTSSDGSNKSTLLKRAEHVLTSAAETGLLQNVAFNETELALTILGLRQQVYGAIPGMEEQLEQVRREIVHRYAVSLGVPLPRNGSAGTELRFSEHGRLIYHLRGMLAASNPTPDLVDKFREDILKDADAARDNISYQATASDLLHDDIFLYASAVQKLILTPNATITPEARERAIRNYIRFVSRDLPKLQDDWSVLDENETSFIEGASLIGQVAVGDMDWVSRTADRIIRRSTPCASSFTGYMLTRIVEEKLKDKPDIHSISALSVKLLRDAAAKGERSFELFNNLQIAERVVGNYSASLEAGELALKYPGEAPWALINKGVLQLELGNFADAEWSFENSLDQLYYRCQTDLKLWAWVDAPYNKRIQESQPPEMRDLLAIPTTVSRKECSVMNAVSGLMLSLFKQGRADDYVLAYQRYFSADDYNLFREHVTEALVMYRMLQCSGASVPTPEIPAAANIQFPVVNGLFKCH
ncbi:MAG: hypothetical protein AAGD15_20240 [Agrobacterium cavarae]|uniref:hypothetical protein n=1 Tax=Agrobacterium cavarae TaxID=2528239 RepID=UPI0031A5D845